MKKIWNTVDKTVFTIGVTVCTLFILWTVLATQTVETVFSGILTTFSTDFGWFYLLTVSFFIAFLLYLALSKFGKIRLGKDNDRPQYTTFSWFFMLFAAGMGIGLVFWSVAEPLSHYITPALGDGRTTAAASEAMRASFTHWGIHPWAIYGIFGLPLAYHEFRKDTPALFSSCLNPLFKKEKSKIKTILGKAVDILAVIATIFGVATSLGLGAMQINSGLHYVFGIPYGNAVMFAIIAIATVLFLISSTSGIDKGIKGLSDFNIVLMVVLLIFIFAVGSTLFVADFFVDTMGKYLSSLLATSFWTDPFKESNGWLNGWTIFYWAWWMSWGPFVGGFIARISKGRTIREFVIGTMLCPMIFCCLFIAIMGGNAIHLDMSGVTGIAEAMEENISYALFALLEQLPLAKITSLAAIVLLAIFFITSADSSTFICASMTSKGSKNPSKAIIVVWGIFEGIVAAILLYTGGLNAVQSVSIAIALPLMILGIFLAVALVKALKTDIKKD